MALKKRAVYVGVIFLLIILILFFVSKFAIKDFKEFFGFEFKGKEGRLEKSEVEGERALMAPGDECDDGIDNDGDGLIDWQYDLGCYGQEDTTEGGKNNVIENGWTVFEPSVDTRIIYVSSSSGSDSYDGMYPEPINSTSGPKKSLMNGMLALQEKCSQYNKVECRWGCSCDGWLLLKRGDVWKDEQFGGQFGTPPNTYGGWALSGISDSAKVMIGSYGDSPKRPLLLFGDRNALPGLGVDNFTLTGLHFYRYTKDPKQAEFNGKSSWNCISFSKANNILLEDNFLDYCGLVVQASPGPIKNFTFRRNVITNSYSVNSHAQSIFTSNVSELLIEENVLDHGGWNDEFRLVLYAPQSDISQWKTIFDGRFDIRLSYAPQSYTTYQIDGLDFTNANSMSDVAQIIENAINNKAGPNAVRFKRTEGNVFMLQSDVFESDANYGIYPYTGSIAGTDISTTDWLNSSSQGVPESTVFNRNMYLSSGYGRTVVRGNIDANGASGGVQQRMGGMNENNLYLRNPHAVSFGHNQNPNNSITFGVIRNNVVLGSRDTDTQVQGSGIGISGSNTPEYGINYANGIEIYGNIIAHNLLGTGNFKGLWMSGNVPYYNINMHDNIVYNWTRPIWPNPSDHRATGFYLAGNAESTNTYFRNNIIQQPDSGFVGSSGNAAIGLILDNNTYYSVENDSGTIWSKGWFGIENAVNSSEWIRRTGETNIHLEKVQFPDPSRNIDIYMAALGETPTYDAFMTKVRNQSRLNWDERFTASAVNDYIREGFGMQRLGGDVWCGDRTCNGLENCNSCPGDCGACNLTCADNDIDGYNSTGGNCGAVDCDDNNAAIYPGAVELCDNINNQCLGDIGYEEVDEGCAISGCILVNRSWINIPFISQNNSFIVEFNVTPLQNNIDGVIGLAKGNSTWYSNLSVAVRFNSNGFIDAGDNSTYRADFAMPYVANKIYPFKLIVNLSSHRFSLYVSKQLLADNYMFRNGHENIEDLDTLSAYDSLGGNTSVCDIRVVGAYVDNLSPIIALNSPTDEIALNTKEVEFNYIVSDYSLITNCTLFIGSQTRINGSITNNAVNSFELDSLENKEYYWNISCVDNYGNIGESETWKLIVNFVSGDSGTTSGPGGGGGISPKPVAKPINMTNESVEIVSEENKIVLGDELSFIEIKDVEEAVIVDLYGNTYKISFVLGEDGDVLARVLNGDYIIPRGEALPISLGKGEMYVGIVETGVNKAKLVMGLNKEKVVGEIGKVEGGEKGIGIGRIYYILFGIVGALIVAIIVLVVWWVVGRRGGKEE